MRLTPLDQPLPNILPPRQRLIIKRLPSPRPKPPKRVLPRTQTLIQLKEPPHITLEVLAVLGVDGVRFSFGAGGVEQRGNEELGETVQCWGERGGLDVKVVAGLVHPREGV
jgi:hypothetical protein